MKFTYFLSILFILPFAIHAMENHKALLERIKTAQQNYATDSFATTLILRYHNSNFTFKGDISTFDAEDEKDILAGNYVEHDCLALAPTRFSPKVSVRILGLVIGTHDPVIAKKIPMPTIFAIGNRIIKGNL